MHTVPSIRATAHQLITDCLKWQELMGDEPVVIEKYASLSAAMLRVARYVRTGAL